MIMKFNNTLPQISPDAYVSETAVVIGDVTVGEGSGIWFGAVVRGDEGKIVIGKNTNIQDNATVHVTPQYHANIGDNVTVGHNAIVHGATVGDNTMIGMSACILNGAKIGKNCIIAAGALVTENTEIPDGKMAVGVPAKIIKDTTEQHIERILKNAETYVNVAKEYKKMQEEK